MNQAPFEAPCISEGTRFCVTEPVVVLQLLSPCQPLFWVRSILSFIEVRYECSLLLAHFVPKFAVSRLCYTLIDLLCSTEHTLVLFVAHATPFPLLVTTFCSRFMLVE